MSVSSLDTPVSNPLPPERAGQRHCTARGQSQPSWVVHVVLQWSTRRKRQLLPSGKSERPGIRQASSAGTASRPCRSQRTSSRHSCADERYASIQPLDEPMVGGQRPPVHPGCGSAPPRPMPGDCAPARPHPVGGRPYPSPSYGIDPGYANKSREQLAQQLLDNFDAFKDRGNAGYVSVNSIREMAKKGWSHDPVMNQNIRLAKELLRRPELVDAIDRHRSTGALDGLINRQKLGMVISDTNFFKYNSDKQLAQEMLEHFDALKGRGWGARPETQRSASAGGPEPDGRLAQESPDPVGPGNPQTR